MHTPDGSDDSARFTETAPAVVLKKWETNVVFNGNPQISLLLAVQPEGQPAFEVEVKTVVNRNRMAQLQPGAKLFVSYSPDTPMKVVIAALP